MIDWLLIGRMPPVALGSHGVVRIESVERESPNAGDPPSLRRWRVTLHLADRPGPAWWEDGVLFAATTRAGRPIHFSPLWVVWGHVGDRRIIGYFEATEPIQQPITIRLGVSTGRFQRIGVITGFDLESLRFTSDRPGYGHGLSRIAWNHETRLGDGRIRFLRQGKKLTVMVTHPVPQVMPAKFCKWQGYRRGKGVEGRPRFSDRDQEASLTTEFPNGLDRLEVLEGEVLQTVLPPCPVPLAPPQPASTGH